MNNISLIASHVDFLVNLMKTVLQRRALRRYFAGVLGGEGLRIENEFIRFYLADYLKAQLVDLRMLFDRKGDVFQVRELIEDLKSSELKEVHCSLLGKWQCEDEYGVSLNNAINKVIAHREKHFPMIDEIKTLHLDGFIDASRDFVEMIIRCASLVDGSVKNVDLTYDADFFKSQREALEELVDQAIKVRKSYNIPR